MAASTQARESSRKPGQIQQYLMGAVKINKGTLVFVQLASGLAFPGRAGTSTDVFVGVAHDTVDNTTGAGNLTILVYKEGTHNFLLASTAQVSIGQPAYAADDQTLTLTATANVLVGYIQSIVDAATVSIKIDRAAQ